MASGGLSLRRSRLGLLAAGAGAVEFEFVVEAVKAGARCDLLLQFAHGLGTLHFADTPAIAADEEIEMFAGREQHVAAEALMQADVTDNARLLEQSDRAINRGEVAQAASFLSKMFERHGRGLQREAAEKRAT